MLSSIVSNVLVAVALPFNGASIISIVLIGATRRWLRRNDG
jgi:hypothetical protein